MSTIRYRQKQLDITRLLLRPP
ncbi:hypothetical protein LINGRAPRIM_LOCUS937 [Linum grandiflorum]